jgi:retron-type reverse transcriptase
MPWEQTMLDDLLEQLNLGAFDPKYSVYLRKKKNGKLRKITAPSDPLKALQGQLNDYLNLRMSPWLFSRPYIVGFVPGRNIKDNAKVHLNKEWVINIDLKDFFPSITEKMISDHFFAHPIFQDLQKEKDKLLKIICYKGALPQGSPCSPAVANMITGIILDPLIVEYAGINNLAYTRYADDLTFSISEKIERHQVIDITNKIIELVNSTKLLKVNTDKVNIKHRSQKQMVTGILVNNQDAAVTKKLRNKMRAILHQHKLKNKPLDDKLNGILNFINQISEEQFAKLTKDFPCKLQTSNFLNQTSPTLATLKHLDS